MNILKCSNDITAENHIFIAFEDGAVSGVMPEMLSRNYEGFKKSGGYDEKSGNAFSNQWMEADSLRTGIVVQAGKCGLKDIEKAAKSIVEVLEANKLEKSILHLEMLDNGLCGAELVGTLTQAVYIGSYRFIDYLTEKKHEPRELYVSYEASEASDKAFEEALALGRATWLAKQMVNEPANVMIPERMADEAKKAGTESGFAVEVYDEKEIEAIGMPAYLTVARASENKPRLIVMEYSGDPDAPEEILGLVGKGLSFDTGGYSIKPGDSMISMKSDMGGAAAVIAAMSAIASRKLKINVKAVVAACENMISGAAYRPGDIIRSRGGKTIYIKSTDAEGRLTLIDAVDYVIKDLGAKKVVDIATLTGAQVVALGSHVTGAVSNDDAFWSHLEKASENSGEKVWRMPLYDEIVETVKHKEADLTNAVREAGMITAGAFIGEFVGETPWIHLDIAGPSWTEKPLGLTKYGATGAGVATLFHLAKNLSM